MSTDPKEKSTTGAQPQQPAPAPPTDKPDLPDKIPEFPGEDSSGKPGMSSDS